MADSNLDWINDRFNTLDKKVDENTSRLVALQTKWDMTTKAVLIAAGSVAFIVSSLILIFWG